MTLKTERQVCKMTPTLLPKEVRKVAHACRSDALDCPICSLIVQAGVEARLGPHRGSAAGPWQTDRDGDLASDGVRAGAALLDVSPGTESGTVVESSSEPRIPGFGGEDVRCHGLRGEWDRRDGGTAAWSEDQS